MPAENGILTPEQVALELSLAVETIRELLRRGLLPGVKVGGSWRTTRRALYGHLENQMGVSGRLPVKRGTNPGKGILPAQGRSPTMGKRREEAPQREQTEIFFER